MKNCFSLLKTAPAHFLFMIMLVSLPVVLRCQASLVKDIVPGNANSFTYDAPNMVALGGKLIFAAETPEYGLELYVSDGTAVGTTLLNDINPGTAGSEIKKLFAGSNYVFFIADDGTHGTEIWRTDGTAQGTIMVKDLAAGSTDGVYNASFDKTAFALDSVFYFISSPTNKGLYKTNGESGNMQLIKYSDDLKDILGAQGGNVYFTQYYYGGNYVASLWKTDGTTPGTQKVKEVNVNFLGVYNYFAAVGSDIYFVFSTLAEGDELWKSDGTQAGTTIVKDIVPGSGHSISSSWSPIYAWKNKIYFITFPGTTGQELWKSDGTDSGTVLVKTLPARYQSLPAGTGRLEMLGLNENLVFTAYNETNGNRDFWVTDGTEQGTTLLASQSNGTYFSPAYLTLFQNKAFFSAILSGKGTELCMSDGTVAGTGLATDINIGSSSSSPQRLVTVDSTLFFSAKTNSTGVELFKYLIPVSGTPEIIQNRMNITIVPNPVVDLLRLHSETVIGNIRIIDERGVTVYVAQVDKTDHNIPALNFRNGVYFVFTESGVKKFVVQK